MNIDKLLEILGSQYSKLLITIVLIFPLAYTCMHLSSNGFQKLELVEQLFYSVSLSIVFVCCTSSAALLANIPINGDVLFPNLLIAGVVITITAIEAALVDIGIWVPFLLYISCLAGTVTWTEYVRRNGKPKKEADKVD